MGLSSIIGIATSGLQSSERGVNLVARNVANAGVEGYTAKTIEPESLTYGGVSSGQIQRNVDQFLQGEINREISQVSYSERLLQSLSRLDQLFGSPGGADSLDGLLNELTQSFQDLSSQPESYTARAQAISKMEDFAGNLRYLSNQIQTMRQLAEDQLAQNVNDLNERLQQVHEINLRISANIAQGAGSADLKDQRDQIVQEISQLIEIDVREGNNGEAVLFTKSGNVLLSGEPATLQFDHHGNINPSSAYSHDEALRTVGAITLQTQSGYGINLLQLDRIESGQVGASLILRDQILPQAQAQLDELAHGLALLTSRNQFDGVGVAGGGSEQGFQVDSSDLKSGDVINITVDDRTAGTQRNITLVAVSPSTPLPLSQELAASLGADVIGFRVDQGLGAIAADLTAALSGVDVSNSGNNLVFLDQGPTGTHGVSALNSLQSANDPQSGLVGIGLFSDGGAAYTGAVDGGLQKHGFASRISVNPAILSNSELLVRFDATTPLGAPERPVALLERMTSGQFTFSSQTGIGQKNAPYINDIHSFTEAIVSFQTGASHQVEEQLQSQSTVLSALQDRNRDETGVNVDGELAKLIELQNAYAANARIIQVADELLQTLLGIA